MSESSVEHRRTFLTGGLVGAAAGLVGAAATGVMRRQAGARDAVAKGRKLVQWRLASSFPSSLDALYGSAEVLADRVAAMTDGAFQIRCHQAWELVPPLQVLDAVQKGSVEVGQTGGYYYVGKSPALAFDTCVPFGLTAREQNAWLSAGGGLELLREVYADFGVLNFSCGCTGAQMGGWFRNRIGSLADMKGLRMRIPGLGGEGEVPRRGALGQPDLVGGGLPVEHAHAAVGERHLDHAGRRVGLEFVRVERVELRGQRLHRCVALLQELVIRVGAHRRR